MTLCEVCNKHANYDIINGKGRFCATHKTYDMIDVISKKCEYTECYLRPAFGIKGGKIQFCASHKSIDMINVKSKRCIYTGCESLNPCFDIKGGKGTFCASHKTNDMIDVKNKRCKYDNCESLNPCFDIPGGKGIFCSLHKILGMIDVKNKECEYEGCNIYPSFDIKGGKGRFCVLHKHIDMINVRSKKCEYQNCSSVPTFDLPNGNGRFCASHKTTDMIDVKNKRCEYNGCKLINPVFDIVGGKGRFCVSHKSSEMINIKSKQCEYNTCTITPTYGLPGQKKTRCFQHRLLGMIRKPNSKCLECKNQAIWGINLTPIHCELHKTDDDINLVERICISCNLLYVLDKSNKCENCNPNTWKTARLAKQNTLMNYLDIRGLNGSSTDTIIDGGICGKERPDRVYDFGDKIIIVECDENQHKERPCECEQLRMINIGQSFGGIPVYFIRWNPDKYKPKNDKKIQEKLSKRHKLCGDLIEDIKNSNIDLSKSLVSAIYLYYDGWSSIVDEKWQSLIIFEDS